MTLAEAGPPPARLASWKLCFQQLHWHFIGQPVARVTSVSMPCLLGVSVAGDIVQCMPKSSGIGWPPHVTWVLTPHLQADMCMQSASDLSQYPLLLHCGLCDSCLILHRLGPQRHVCVAHTNHRWKVYAQHWSSVSCRVRSKPHQPTQKAPAVHTGSFCCPHGGSSVSTQEISCAATADPAVSSCHIGSITSAQKSQTPSIAKLAAYAGNSPKSA